MYSDAGGPEAGPPASGPPSAASLETREAALSSSNSTTQHIVSDLTGFVCIRAMNLGRHAAGMRSLYGLLLADSRVWCCQGPDAPAIHSTTNLLLRLAKVLRPVVSLPHSSHSQLNVVQNFSSSCLKLM